jgi:hypothetical protein
MVEAEEFVWSKVDADAYEVSPDQRTVVFSGTPGKEYRTAIGSKGFTSGKHYWRIQVACDNIRVGIATGKADPSVEFGADTNSWACNLQTGDVLHNCKEPRSPTPDGLSARLYKLLVPISGGMVGIVLDLDEGKASLFFNDEYQGILVSDPNLKNKGPIHPAVGVGGIEGKECIVQTEKVKLPKTYTYKRNKM